tara:strand:+ start:1164 stop:1826 length:663 start_codon:yes stop_codon:yes gene_type:complete
MTQTEMFPTVTSSPQDIHANRSVQRERERAQKMTATSGRTSSKLLHPKDPLGAFSKTFMGTSHWDSTRCSLTWNTKATPQGRLLFQLAASTLPTKETESGLLPTPTTQDNPQVKGNPEHPKRGTTLGGYARMFPTPAAADSKGTTGGGQNSSLRTHVRMFPTPTANEDAAGTPNGKMQKMLGNHPAVRGTTKEEWASGTLNPTWVEWLMGYPKEWTELKD